MLEASARQQRRASAASQWADYSIYSFGTSWPVLLLVADILLALALQKAWVLYASMMILFSQILWIVLKWLLYVVDDPDLWNAVALIRGLGQLFLMESESIARGDASRFLAVGAFAYTAPSGIGYARHVLRYRMQQMNHECLRGLTEDHRFEPTAKCKAELSILVKRGKAGVQEANRRIAVVEARRRIAMEDGEEKAKT